MVEKTTFARGIMAWICSGHVMNGLVALVSGEPLVRQGQKMYGADFEPNDQFLYILRPTGAFMLALAFLQAQAVREPHRYKHVFDATILVFLLRQFQRFAYKREACETFGIPTTRHFAMTFYFQILTALLVFGRLQLRDDA